jgi:hypothetical protein
MASQLTYGAAKAGAAGANVSQAWFSSKIGTLVHNGVAANVVMSVPGLNPIRDEIISATQVRAGLRISLLTGLEAGPYTLTGITTSDRIVSVLSATEEADISTLTDITSEFSITDTDEIDNTGGTDQDDPTVNQLWVIWEDTSTSRVDLTSLTSIAPDGIKISTSTVGSRVIILYALRGAFGEN